LFAKEDYESIAQHIVSKSAADVEEYSKVFFEKLETLNDCEKIKKNVEKAERMLSFK
jgi:hypothetical protein